VFIKSLYNKILKKPGIKDCVFYHTMDIPGHGEVKGEWDLRGRERAYFGNLDFKGKRVLEMGTSSGHLCFWMEKQGARVTGYDLSRREEWDIVPYKNFDYKKHLVNHQKHIEKMNNSFWFARRAFGSSAKIIYGNIYNIPGDIGTYDIGTFGSILLHLRDPFNALRCVSPHIREAITVTDRYYPLPEDEIMVFQPYTPGCWPYDTWWKFTPEIIREFLNVLGFRHTELSFSTQLHYQKEIEMFTLVGRRKMLYTPAGNDRFGKYRDLPEKNGGIGRIDGIQQEGLKESMPDQPQPSAKEPQTVYFNVSANKRFSVSGWAYHENLSRHDHKIFIQLVNTGSGIHYEIPASRQRREDIEKDYGKYAGFITADIEKQALEPGMYYMFILQVTGDAYIKYSPGACLTVGNKA